MKRYLRTPGRHSQLCLLSSALLLASMLLVLSTQTASAHAKVISATPAIGSTIAQAPTTVTVVTSQNINPDPKMSLLQVYGPDGELISQGDAKVPLSKPTEMSVALKPGGNGIYVVCWVTASADDNEQDEGAFIFTVNPQAASSGPKVAPPSSTASPTTTAVGVPFWILLLSCVVTLLAGLLGGFAFGRRAASSLGRMRQTVAGQRETTPTEPR